MEPTRSPHVNRDDATTEWEYPMRREMQEIVPGLFLGPYASANKAQLENLKNHGITHIVCVCQPSDTRFIRPNFPDHFKYLVLTISDSVIENIIKYFHQVKYFLDECYAFGGKALVHGNTGISRSAALVMAYVMEKFGFTFKQAFQLVQTKRFCVNPNEGFVQQLMEYEPIYKARLEVENTPPSNLIRSDMAKRKFEDDVDDDVLGMDQGN